MSLQLFYSDGQTKTLTAWSFGFLKYPSLLGFAPAGHHEYSLGAMSLNSLTGMWTTGSLSGSHRTLFGIM
jgi:hypothetical protein